VSEVEVFIDVAIMYVIVISLTLLSMAVIVLELMPT
jgi:hypothetical protein